MYESERTHTCHHDILYLQQFHKHVGMVSLALMLPWAVRREVEDPESVLHRLTPQSGLVKGEHFPEESGCFWALTASLGSKLKFLGLSQPDNWLDQSHSISEDIGPSSGHWSL